MGGVLASERAAMDYLPLLRTPQGFLKTLSNSLLGSLTKKGIIKDFEQSFTSWLGIESMAVPSARSGLYFILKSLKLTKNKDEVILAAYNFHAMPAMVRAARLIPRYVDVEPHTYTIDQKQLKQALSEKTAAILVTHMYGLPADMDAILSIADKFGVPVIEDCAHAMGATYTGKLTGTFGSAAVFSFGMTKPLPCAGGGMIVVRDPGILHTVREQVSALSQAPVLSPLRIAAKAGMVAIGTHRRIYHPFTRELFQLGYRRGKDIGDALLGEREGFEDSQVPQRAISPLQATLGLNQLPNLGLMNQRRVKNAEQFSKLLGKKIAPHIPHGRTHVYVHYPIRVREPEAFRETLWKRGIQMRRSYIRNCAESRFKNTDEAQASVVYLPVHSSMTQTEIEGLAQAVLDEM